eukprot:4103147-Pyramimonas_sp.AAC.1
MSMYVDRCRRPRASASTETSVVEVQYERVSQIETAVDGRSAFTLPACNIHPDAYYIHPNALNIHHDAYTIHLGAYIIHHNAYNIHPDVYNIRSNRSVRIFAGQGGGMRTACFRLY